jgi:hypothetical protein
MNPYKSARWYTVVYNKWKISIITKDKIDVMDWVIFLPLELIQFILSLPIPSPLEVSVLLTDEEIWGLIDAICYSPDEQRWFLTLKNLFYISR